MVLTAEEITRLRRSSGGQRTSFNLTVRSGDRLADLAQSAPSPQTSSQLERCYTELREKYSALIATIIRLIENVPEMEVSLDYLISGVKSAVQVDGSHQCFEGIR